MEAVRGLKFLLLSLLLSCFTFYRALGCKEKVTVTVKGVTSIASTDDNFICATMDWWPPTKCDYGMCPWGLASVLNIDLKNPNLQKSLKAFGNMRIRIGGSLQDQIHYNVGKATKRCPTLMKQKEGFMFGFSEGCLHMKRWDEVYDFFNQTGVKITFGLNALSGRQKQANTDLWVGPWDSSNARDFMEHIISKGQRIDSWELGNELSGGGVAARVEAHQYGEDIIRLKGLVNELWSDSSDMPKVLAPGGFFDQKWFSEFLQVSGPGIVDAVTHHFYNMGPGVDENLIYKMQDPYTLDNVVQTLSDMEVTLRSFAPWSSAWVGEAGGAYNSGGKVSHSFVDSFWYLDQLGLSSSYDTKVYCRQSLIGGNYGLLNTTTMAPNPDYYSALLWHRLMGTRVLSTTHGGSPFLRAYAHCSKNEPGITMMLINLSNTTSFHVSVAQDMNIYPPRVSLSEVEPVQREEYHLTPKDGDLRSNTMVLNGVPLELTESGDIPALNPILVDASPPIEIVPSSIAFVRVKDFRAPAC